MIVVVIRIVRGINGNKNRFVGINLRHRDTLSVFVDKLAGKEYEAAKKIEEQAIEYINAYIKVAQKKRVKYKARFRESSLINFHKELRIQ